MKNDSDGIGKKDKKINRIKDQLAKLREKLKASEDQQPPIPSKSKHKKIKPERLKFLNDAAKKYGFKDFVSVKGRNNRINIAKEATRRQDGIAEGKGRPGVERD